MHHLCVLISLVEGFRFSQGVGLKKVSVPRSRRVPHHSGLQQSRFLCRHLNKCLRPRLFSFAKIVCFTLCKCMCTLTTSIISVAYFRRAPCCRADWCELTERRKSLATHVFACVPACVSLFTERLIGATVWPLGGLKTGLSVQIWSFSGK